MKIVFQNSSIVFRKQASIDKNYFANPVGGSSTGYSVKGAQLNTSFSPAGDWQYNVANQSVTSAVIPVSAGDVILFSGSSGSPASAAINGYNSMDRTAGKGYGFVRNILDWSQTSYKNKKITITDEMVSAGIVCVRVCALNDGNQSVGIITE